MHNWIDRRINLLALLSMALISVPTSEARSSKHNDAKTANAATSQPQVVDFATIKSNAKKGDLEAQCALADAYETGKGVEKNHQEAMKLYKSVAFSPTSKVKVTSKDEAAVAPSDLVKELTKLADSGDATAQNKLGYLYESGIDGKKDLQKAESLYKAAVAKGSAAAMDNLAVLYMGGSYDNDKYLSAIPTLRKAAQLGDLDAIANLGYLYEKGIGMDRSYGKAAELFLKAAAHSNPAGEYNLGYLYQRGLGVPKDLDKCEVLYAKAKMHTKQESEYSIGFMSKLMPSSEFVRSVKVQSARVQTPGRKLSANELGGT